MTATTVTLGEDDTTYIVEGTVSHGGSNSYGSDEPAWTEIEDLRLFSAMGSTLTDEERLIGQHGDYLCEKLLEAVSCT